MMPYSIRKLLSLKKLSEIYKVSIKFYQNAFFGKSLCKKNGPQQLSRSFVGEKWGKKCECSDADKNVFHQKGDGNQPGSFNEAKPMGDLLWNSGGRGGRIVMGFQMFPTWFRNIFKIYRS